VSGTFIIAEAGVNHNGSLDSAVALIDVAATAGADAVKFQTFRSEAVISRAARKAQYQITNTGNEDSQLEMVRALELTTDHHRVLIDHARSRGIAFLSTPFDLDSVQLLAHEFRLPRLKIASGEITNLPLLLAAGRVGCPLLVSTGMSTLGEVEQALQVIAFAYATPPGTRPTAREMEAAYRDEAAQLLLSERVTLLHCTTEYPAPVADANLRALDTLRTAFGLPVGFSDHTLGTHIAIAAVARGAAVIEKHFTLDRSLPGPDHVASLEPEELAAMVRGIRDVEQALGSGRKVPAPSEWKNIAIARKSLIAARPIKRGEAFSAANLTTKRPGSGVSAMKFYDYLGRIAQRDYGLDELIDEL
jgi:N-acetylneuraminate synthase